VVFARGPRVWLGSASARNAGGCYRCWESCADSPKQSGERSSTDAEGIPHDPKFLTSFLVESMDRRTRVRFLTSYFDPLAGSKSAPPAGAGMTSLVIHQIKPSSPD